MSAEYVNQHLAIVSLDRSDGSAAMRVDPSNHSSALGKSIGDRTELVIDRGGLKLTTPYMLILDGERPQEQER